MRAGAKAQSERSSRAIWVAVLLVVVARLGFTLWGVFHPIEVDFEELAAREDPGWDDGFLEESLGAEPAQEGALGGAVEGQYADEIPDVVEDLVSDDEGGAGAEADGHASDPELGDDGIRADRAEPIVIGGHSEGHSGRSLEDEPLPTPEPIVIPGAGGSEQAEGDHEERAEGILERLERLEELHRAADVDVLDEAEEVEFDPELT